MLPAKGLAGQNGRLVEICVRLGNTLWRFATLKPESILWIQWSTLDAVHHLAVCYAWPGSLYLV